MADIHHIEQAVDQTTPIAAGSSSDTISSCDFRLPAVFDQCEMVDELGRGGGGIVFLARQPHLGNRLVVVKFIARSESEHLSLARLQHPNIVPLFEVYDCDPQDQRALCMPFFGSLTLSHILNQLYETPCNERQGRDIIECLDAARALHAPALSHEGAARDFLLKADYVRAICWMGASLADGLHYAHERGLVHLDLKPSNILFATDGNPMLLDFHLARAPLRSGETPAFLGGTARYMAPEQLRATADVAENRPVSEAVDGRADIFALGAVLFEALAGKPPYTPGLPVQRLHELNPHISAGLSDIIQRCLEVRSSNRYEKASELARDLRLHLESKPLVGVANRSVAERWQKWRKRRPLQIVVISLLMTFLSGLLTAGVIAWKNAAERRQMAAQLHAEGARQFEKQLYAQANETLAEAFELTQSFGGDRLLAQKLGALLQLSKRAQKASELHTFADKLRLHSLAEAGDQRSIIVLDVGCRTMWQARDFFLKERDNLLSREKETQIRRDLVELAIGWADIRLQLLVRESLETRRQQASVVLNEAESLIGPNSALAHAQQQLGVGERDKPSFADDAWAHGVLGRVLLQANKLDQAAHELETALQMQPGDFWSNYCYGVCCVRRDEHRRALDAFSVCIHQQPRNDEAYVRRGHTYALLKDWHHAAEDFQQALKIRPNVSNTLLQLAKAQLALGDVPTARTTLWHLLNCEPKHSEARKLLDEIGA